MVFELDLRRAAGKTLGQIVKEQCFRGTRRSAAELSALMHDNQRHVLFLLDGFEVRSQAALF